MIYLDDVAVWLHTQKGSILRGCLCAGVLLSAGVIGLSSWNKYDSQKEEIKKNEVSIAEYNYQLDAVSTRIENYDKNADVVYYSPKDVCDGVNNVPGIAKLQTKYGGYEEHISISAITEEAKLTRDSLAEYVTSGSKNQGVVPWFPDVNTHYEWVYPMQEESVVADVPVIWVCKSDRSNSDDIYAVTTGVYHGETNRCDDFDIYYTVLGRSILDKGSEPDSDEIVDDVDGLLSKDKDENLYEDGEGKNEDIEDDDMYEGLSEYEKEYYSDPDNPLNPDGSLKEGFMYNEDGFVVRDENYVESTESINPEKDVDNAVDDVDKSDNQTSSDMNDTGVSDKKTTKMSNDEILSHVKKGGN